MAKKMRKHPEMVVIKNPPKAMVVEANKLNEGGVMVIYKDCNAIRMETVDGADPYVWRNNHWVPMLLEPGWIF